MTDVDFNLLRALDALLTEGSVAGAARRLGLSPSAMSRTLARLRRTMGDQLLIRAGSKMVPTPQAEKLREKVRDLTREAMAVLSPSRDKLCLSSLDRTFTFRANEAFIAVFAPRLITERTSVAPGIRLHFPPKPEKTAGPLREGPVDLEIGVLGEMGPEIRIQSLFRDSFVGAVRTGHPLSTGKEITPDRYVAFGHVVTSRRGRGSGPVDEALAKMGLKRNIVAVVPSFRAALEVARSSDLVALVAASFLMTDREGQAKTGRQTFFNFPLPVTTDPITVSLMWHPRLEADPAHRWLRSLVTRTCRMVQV